MPNLLLRLALSDSLLTSEFFSLSVREQLCVASSWTNKIGLVGSLRSIKKDTYHPAISDSSVLISHTITRVPSIQVPDKFVISAPRNPSRCASTCAAHESLYVAVYA